MTGGIFISQPQPIGVFCLIKGPQAIFANFGTQGPQGAAGGSQFPSDSITLSGNQSNWPLVATNNLHLINATGNYTITGVANGATGVLMILHNVGTGVIEITANDPASLAQNQFNMSGLILLAPGGTFLFIYNGTNWSKL